jgi:hypothetical protein
MDHGLHGFHSGLDATERGIGTMPANTRVALDVVANIDPWNPWYFPLDLDGSRQRSRCVAGLSQRWWPNFNNQILGIPCGGDLRWGSDGSR